MIRGYKQQEAIDAPSESCTIYKATKDGKVYLMHEFESLNESDDYTFKIRKKLKCSHIVPLVDEFEEKDYKYYISEFIETDLLRLALSRNAHVLQLSQAVEYLARIFEVLEQMHSHKLVYRNLLAEKIRMKDNEPYFYDFSMSQFTKRKERLFEVVGCASILAPEFFSEDGYGEEVDIWAAGVLFYYLIVHEYPFKFKTNQEAAFRQEFHLKCGDGFRFSKMIEGTVHDVPPLRHNKHLQDFFRKIFHPNPNKRITISEIKQHPLFEGHFPNQMDKDILSVIQQNGRQQSVFLSKMYKFPCSKILHKEEIILDFIEQTSQLFLLECPEIYTEDLRYRAQFAVLKVGLIKTNTLLDIFYGIREPSFNIDPEEWKMVRASSALNLVKDKLERKKKILHMIYKSAYMQVSPLAAKDPFFSEKIPETFEEIKISYRGALSEMFDVGRKSLSKAKGNRQLSRKLTESLVRVIILFLVNRLFESEEQTNVDFQQYLSWSKRRDLEDLQEWIETEELANLKLFMKAVTTKYL